MCWTHTIRYMLFYTNNILRTYNTYSNRLCPPHNLPWITKLHHTYCAAHLLIIMFIYICTHQIGEKIERKNYNCWPLANLSFNGQWDKGVLKTVKPTLKNSEASSRGKKLVLGVKDMSGIWNNFLSRSNNCFFKKSLKCGMQLNSHTFHGSLCSLCNLGFQVYTKIAKPGWDAISKNALDCSMIKEKQRFLVNSKDPQPRKENIIAVGP